jgi:hypothetical protein
LALNNAKPTDTRAPHRAIYFNYHTKQLDIATNQANNQQPRTKRTNSRTQKNTNERTNQSQTSHFDVGALVHGDLRAFFCSVLIQLLRNYTKFEVLRIFVLEVGE